MKIDKAIKLLRGDIDNPGSVAIEDVNEAEELGIEALKRLRDYRLYHPPNTNYSFCSVLPGETEDEKLS